MRTTVRTYWMSMLLMLAYGINSHAIDFAKTDYGFAKARQAVASLSFVSDHGNTGSAFTHVEISWSSDLELGSKSMVDVYSLNQQRLRRAIEDNLFLKHVFLILSNHENLLVQGQSSFSYKASYAGMGSDYYVFMLRRILI